MDNINDRYNLRWIDSLLRDTIFYKDKISYIYCLKDYVNNYIEIEEFMSRFLLLYENSISNYKTASSVNTEQLLRTELNSKSFWFEDAILLNIDEARLKVLDEIKNNNFPPTEEKKFKQWIEYMLVKLKKNDFNIHNIVDWR